MVHGTRRQKILRVGINSYRKKDGTNKNRHRTRDMANENTTQIDENKHDKIRIHDNQEVIINKMDEIDDIRSMVESDTAQEQNDNSFVIEGKNQVICSDSDDELSTYSSDAILQQEHIIQDEDIPDGDVSEDSPALLELSKEGLENSDSTVNIQNLEDAISSISTKQENDDCDNHTNDENKVCVNNEEILTVEGEGICQLEGKPATQKLEVDIVTKGKDKAHSNTSTHLNHTKNPKQKRQKDNTELWDLLNYSKVRLATGSIPKKENDNISIEHKTLKEIEQDLKPLKNEEEVEIINYDKKVQNEDHNIDHFDEFKSHNSTQLDLTTEDSRYIRLSAKEKLQAMILAEKAANEGAAEFSTERVIETLHLTQASVEIENNKSFNFDLSFGNTKEWFLLKVKKDKKVRNLKIASKEKIDTRKKSNLLRVLKEKISKINEMMDTVVNVNEQKHTQIK